MVNKIELVDVIPTEKEIVNYWKYISSLNSESDNGYETPYTITDEELTSQKLYGYHKHCQEHGIDADYLLASLITAKTFEINKGNSDGN